MSKDDLEDQDMYQIMVNWWAVIVCCYCVHGLCIVLHFVILTTSNFYMYTVVPVYITVNIIITIFVIYGKKYAAGIKVAFVDAYCFGSCLNDFNYSQNKGKFDDYEGDDEEELNTNGKLEISDYDESLEESLGEVINIEPLNEKSKPMNNIENEKLSTKKQDVKKSKKALKNKKTKSTGPRKLVIAGGVNSIESEDFKNYIIEDPDQRNNLLNIYAKSFVPDENGLIIITNGWNYETYSSQLIIEKLLKNRRMRV